LLWALQTDKLPPNCSGRFMTNSPSNMNIDDVLSSVRRLVSDDGRAKASSEGTSQAPVIYTEERLVLTDPVTLSSQDSAPAEESVVDAAVIEPAQHEPDLSQAEPPEGPVVHPVAAEDIENEVIVADGFTIGDSVDVADPNDTRAMASLEETIAGLEFVISQQGISFEPDGSEVSQAERAGNDDLARQITDEAPPSDTLPVEPISDQAPPDASLMTEPPESPMMVQNDVRATELSDQVEEARPGISAEDEWQGWVAPPPETEISTSDPDQVQQETTAPTDPAPEAAEAAAPTVDVVPDEAQAIDEPPSLPQDEGILSEDLDLKELVGDLVREELQGELGERITRSVRKLVRREVQRILAAQDLK
jgi:hypothetical protein